LPKFMDRSRTIVYTLSININYLIMKKNTGTQIEEILETILSVGGILPKYKAYKGKSIIKPDTFYHSLYRLKQKGLIYKTKNKQKQTIFVITDKGREILRKPLTKVKRSDGFATLITFDIPEEKRKLRNILRKFLVDNGFTILQKSILISPNKVGKDLLKLVRELKLTPYVKIVSGKIEYVL
jgi:DNA-binding PadR family transcriptional regulator